MENLCEQYDATSIQQLHKVVTDTENGGIKNKDVFPVSVIQSVFDALTGTRLDQILALGNCIYIPFQGTRQATRLKIGIDMRRKGLIVVFRDLSNKTYTQRYIYDKSVADDHWQDDACWEDCFVGFGELEFMNDLKEYIADYIDEKIAAITPPDGYEFVIVKKEEIELPEGYEYVVYIDENGTLQKVYEGTGQPIIRKIITD